MVRITIHYDDGRLDEVCDAAQFILFHVPPSDKVEQLVMTAQCSAEFLWQSITEENARGYYKQAFKAMSRKRLGERQ
ncbi:hypothetical protein [Cohnella boryungensis]|uniref:Uncharacterized protein n=1 Tax=Cohnella boryungensis TaxID=768479 RepID=A0ABV8SE12_9BACL